ncbi:MAG: proline--tRNA ligase [Candidatus Woesearchaeota archaeon]
MEKNKISAKKDDNKIGITVKKSENFSEWYTQICSEQGADLVDVRYGVAGFVVHKHWAFKILRKIYDLLDKEIEDDGHEPFLFPTVIPEENLLKEKEHAGFAPDVFWVTHGGDQKLERKVALRPTGETALYPMYALWIRSYKDLPFKRYQSRITVFRNEKTTRPFLRGREFMFYEAHDVFASHKEAMDQINKDMEIMKKVAYDRLKLPFIFFKRPKWDKFLGAVDTYASDTIMPDGKRNQCSSTHDLGHNFAKVYDVTFIDKDGEEKYGYQTCFGPGIYRMMAALIGIHGDDNGLILPTAVSPVHFVIIPITFSKKPELNNKVISKCKEVEETIKKVCTAYNVAFDDAEESPGYKYNKWELLGVPFRIEIGPREADADDVTIVNRITKEKSKLNLKNIEKELAKLIDNYENLLKKRADEYFKGNTKDADNLKDVKKIIEEHRGFIRVPWCSTESDGEKCAETLKAETIGGYVSGTKFENPEKPKKGQKCIICGRPAEHIVYIAKSY